MRGFNLDARVRATGLAAFVRATGLDARVRATGLGARVRATGLGARVRATGLGARDRATGLGARVRAAGLEARVRAIGLDARVRAMTGQTRRIAPYGTWRSPVTADLVAGRTIGLSSLSADGGDLYWLEQRPSENGRTVLVRRRADGDAADLTPPPLDVASRVHEYGGGAYHARDGRVVFSDKRDGAVRLLDGDGTIRVVTAVEGCRYADFRLAPDGRSAVAVREDARDRPANHPENTIVRLDLDRAVDPAANAGTVLVRGPDFVAAPRLAPEGAALLWLEWDQPDMPWDATRLCVARLDADGTPVEVRRIAGGPATSIVQPEWEADGAVLYASDRTGWWNLERVTPGGAAVAICPMEAEIGGPAWVFGRHHHHALPDGTIVAAIVRDGRVRAAAIEAGRARDLAWPPVAECPVTLADPSGGFRLAAIATPPDAPPQIVLGPVERSGAAGGPGAPPALRSLRAASPPALSAADISVAETLSFPTEDGGTGHAFWYPPANATTTGPADEKPPLIVISHGGPTSMSTDALSSRVQWWTSRGFGVVDVNYGGSTGFGRAYRRRLDGQWGVVDVADCIAAARHLVATGRVDPRRIAIRGGSAGGFTTLAALVASDVFAAGASHYGVADLTLLAGDTHKFEARYLDRLVGPLPDAEALYRARSPITHADRLSCPVIFFQGLDDKVVPPNQARAMAAALASRGVEAPVHEFAGEGHGFRREDTIRRVLALELAFYGAVFGFEPDPG